MCATFLSRETIVAYIEHGKHIEIKHKDKAKSGI